MAKTSLQILAEAIARRHQIEAKEAATFAEAIFDIINEGLKRDKVVQVKGLGTFKILTVKARESINVNTGGRVLIEGHDKVSFIPDTSMKELVNKPFSQFETVVLNEGVELDNVKDIETLGETAEFAVNAEATAEQVEANVSERQQTAEEEAPTEEKEAKPSIGEEEKVSEAEETVEDFSTNSPEEAAAEIEEKPQPEGTETEPAEQGHRVRNAIFILLGSLIVCAGLYFAGYYVGRMEREEACQSGMVDQTNKKPSARVVARPTQKSEKPIVPDTLMRQNPQTKCKPVEPVDEYAQLNHHPKIRYGAYNIIGVDKIVVLRKGQTMESYSRKTLGKDMVGYFQVLNGTDSMHAGDTMKVPKVELRPQYRR